MAKSIVPLIVTAAQIAAGGGVQRASAQESLSDVGVIDVARSAPEAGGIVDLPRLTGAVILDGRLDEAAWQSVPPLALTMYEPTYRGESGRRIELRLGYDDEAIYLAARFHHDDPEAIRAFSLTRDRWSGDDGFGLLLDTFNDNENAVRFVGLPLSTRIDMSISGGGVEERGSGGPRGSSWNAFWDYRTHFFDDGWTGEMRIPFSELRFETGSDGSAVMGLMAYAYEPGTESRWTYPAIPRSAAYTQVDAWQDVRIRDVEPRNPTYVTPYALTGSAQSAVLPVGAPGWSTQTDEAVEAGLDVKFNPTANLTLDLSYNTDFAAVEADQQQVNLTRFSLFFDERRAFFQERAGIFSFGTGADRGTLFYSRRIGLQDTGTPVPIVGGARLVGRVGAWDLGAINMQTEGLGDAPGENFGVLRLRRQVLNPNSFVGAMSTSRVGNDGAYNVTWGLDALLRPFGDEFVTLKVLQTIQGGDELRSAAPSGFDAGRLVTEWTRRRTQGLSYTNVFVWSGAGYEPGIGFEARRDFTRAQSDWNYQWFPEAGSRWRRVWLGVESNAWMRNADGVVETAEFEPFFQLETQQGLTLRAEVSATLEDVVEAFGLGEEASVPADRYVATEGSVQFRSPRGWDFRPNLTLRAGQFFDGRRIQVNSDFNWPVSKHLELIGGVELNRIRFDARDQSFDANLVRLTTRVAANVHASLDVFGQYNSLTDQLTTNARFRYQFREGQDLWLVWNEGLNLERDVLDAPRLPLTDVRTLTLKYTHTLIF